MIELIGRLVAGGHAYPVEGDVYFAISSFAPYGRLSGKNLDDLLAGARVEVDERKRDPRDFALWKGAKPGEPSWDSPWGPGRPGWHIECSAMAMKYLGVSFDLHGGGEDLIFPHHECEIAQAEACTGKPFARYWVHNGMVNMGKEKMSKSLGNTLSIREIVKRHSPDTLRLWMLGTHYRNLIEWSEERVEESKRALERLTRLLHDAAAVRDGGARRRCPRHSRSSARASRRRWTTTSTRRRRSACSSISAERWPTRATGVPAPRRVRRGRRRAGPALARARALRPWRRDGRAAGGSPAAAHRARRGAGAP
jgi:cysteinyl-tRNA synthetase